MKKTLSPRREELWPKKKLAFFGFSVCTHTRNRRVRAPVVREIEIEKVVFRERISVYIYKQFLKI